jgi:hypothetical protein
MDLAGPGLLILHHPPLQLSFVSPCLLMPPLPPPRCTPIRSPPRPRRRTPTMNAA